MPTYNFKCPCGFTVEEQRKFGENYPPDCPKCDHRMKQVIGSNPFVLKGSGWDKASHYGHKWKLGKKGST